MSSAENLEAAGIYISFIVLFAAAVKPLPNVADLLSVRRKWRLVTQQKELSPPSI